MGRETREYLEGVFNGKTPIISKGKKCYVHFDDCDGVHLIE